MLPLFDSQPSPPLAEALHSAIRNGATVIAANARAARSLRMLYAQKQREAGVTMWPSPPIYDWQTWLQSLWQAATLIDPTLALLLTPMQEHLLWNRVQQEDAQLVVSSEGMADLAQSAYSLLNDYELHSARRNEWTDYDAERFRQWSRMFDQLCREQNWITPGETTVRLSTLLAKLPMPPRVRLIGFDRFTPAQEHLFDSVRARAVDVDALEVLQHDPVPVYVRANDAIDEMLACAQWCRHKLEVNPALRIGVIAPDIRRIQPAMDRIFRSTLMPQSLHLVNEADAMPFEFSLGTPLSSTPVVRSALLLLRWVLDSLPEEAATWLLISSFIGSGPDEASALAQFDFKQRSMGSLSPEVALPALVNDLRRSKIAALDTCVRRLQDLQRLAQQRVFEETSWARWCSFAEECLAVAGWPGYRTPDSVQFQAQKRWERLLDEVAQLDFADRAVSYRTFLKALDRQAGETIFTAESHFAPIQIIGAFESSGQTFDAIWFLGADDTQWPAIGRPHPLIPAALQRSARMPHSTAALDTEAARAVMTRLTQSAPEVLISYARQNKEGELRPSPLIPRHAEIVSTTDLRRQLQISPPEAVPSLLEDLPAEHTVAPWPKEQVAGGAHVLKSQAACPFQAFAMRRLASRELNRTEWGLSAAERGNLLHRIMDSVWSPDSPEEFCMVSLTDLQRVIAGDRLNAVLEHHIARNLQRYREHHADDAWMLAYLDSEQARLLARLREWLEQEAEREPFLVESREQKLSDVSVGGLKLNLRADRIDLLPDESHLLIDYKTGKVSTAGWQGDRPDEPQLPIYAVYGNVENVSGLLFAQIRSGDTGFVGRVDDARARLIANLSSSNALVTQPYDESMRDGWRQALLGIAQEFLEGEAVVDPKRGSKTCQFCPLPGLCRIAEVGNSITDNDEESAND